MTNLTADHRRAARTNVLLAATLERNMGQRNSVRVANLSASGALVFGDLLPLREEQVTLICGNKKLAGRVAWADVQHAGVAFDQPIDPLDVLPKRTVTATLIVKDEREVDFRRPGFRGNQLTSEERVLLDEWKRSREGDDSEPPPR